MRIKILKKCQGLRGVLRPGNVIEMDEAHAKEYIAQGFAVDQQAEERQTKIVTPEKKKRWNDLSPELERIANNPPHKKRGRPRKK